MNFLAEKSKTEPWLRFRDFRGGWKTRPVGSICGSIVPGRNKPTDFSGDIPWITTPDFQHNSRIETSVSGLAISKHEAKKVGSKIVPEDSVIISCVGDLGLVAIAGNEVVINQQLHAFLPSPDVTPRFLLYAISVRTRYMDRVATKTAVPYMNKENCNSIPVVYPTIPEQRKIADFLTAVDGRFQQLIQKKALLADYKKGVMQQLFTQVIRFKDDQGNDFSEEWVSKKYNEVFHIGAGGDIDKDRLSPILADEFPFPVFANAEKKNGLYGYASYFKEEGGCVTVSGRGNLGTPHARHEPFVPIVRLLVLRPRFTVDVNFFEAAISRTRFFVESTGVPQLTGPQIGGYNISFPSLPEQTKIASFLSAIDRRIESITTQITEIETFKRGLLQQMFV